MSEDHQTGDMKSVARDGSSLSRPGVELSSKLKTLATMFIHPIANVGSKNCSLKRLNRGSGTLSQLGMSSEIVTTYLEKFF